MARVLAIALTIGAAVWVAALFLAALPGIGPLSSIVYGIGAVVCHQRPERSFSIEGSQFPVCARCAGLYISGALAAVIAWLGASRAPKHTREILLVAAGPTLLTIPVEWLGLSPLSNTVRAAAALPLGAAAGWTFVRILRAENGPLAERSTRVAL